VRTELRLEVAVSVLRMKEFGGNEWLYQEAVDGLIRSIDKRKGR
jgi:hypothetical protein